MITRFKEEHARAVAELHVTGISSGFISSLGVDFVTLLYMAIARSDSSFGFVGQDGGKISGFVAMTANLGGLYKTAILRAGPRLGLLLAVRVLSSGGLKKVFETLLYPARKSIRALPCAELLSVVVAEDRRRSGIGTALIQRGLAECHRRGIERLKVLVGAGNEAANSMYLKSGFEFAGQIHNHGVASNLYVVQTASALEEAQQRVLTADRSEERFEIREIPSSTIGKEAASKNKREGRISQNEGTEAHRH